MSDIRSVNPWTWQNRLGFSQALDVRSTERVIYCAGQTSVDGEGRPLHPGDMAKQIAQALDNLEKVLAQAGLELKNVVRLNYYTTDVSAFVQAGAAFAPRLASAGCKPASTLLGVASLFHPDLMIEIEATAVE